MAKKHKSNILKSVHDTVKDLHGAGLVDKKTMREFDASCLTEVKEFSPKQIAKLRKQAGVSQALFATYLNVTTGLVSQWERGEKKPGGASLKLINLVEKKGLEVVA
ncbi:MAG: DNA-binding transcriptional regulator [Alphaproteobacteria bacterium]|nr:DNA-binding transcriptional regulator [Alphaproteobacteria bacterium]